LKVKYGDFTALDIREPISIEKGDKIGLIGSNGAGKTTFVKAILGLVKYSGKITSEINVRDMAVHMQENNYALTMPVKYIIQAVLDTDIRGNKRLKDLIDFFDFITSGLDFETREELMAKIREWYKYSENSLCIVTHYYDELKAMTNKLLILEKGRVATFGRTTELFEWFCGKTLIIVNNNEENKLLTKEFPQSAAPEHLLVLPFNSIDDEIRTVTKFSAHNIDLDRDLFRSEFIFD
jgi:ABC-2 type transport system ATP-binding protein